MAVSIPFSNACMILSLGTINMCPLSGEGESQTGVDKEFCLYRGILGTAHGQLFQLP